MLRKLYNSTTKLFIKILYNSLQNLLLILHFKKPQLVRIFNLVEFGFFLFYSLNTAVVLESLEVWFTSSQLSRHG